MWEQAPKLFNISKKGVRPRFIPDPCRFLEAYHRRSSRLSASVVIWRWQSNLFYYICLSLCLPLSLSTYIYIYYISYIIYLSIYPSIHPSIYPSIYLSTYLSIDICIDICIDMYIYIQAHTHTYIHLYTIFSFLNIPAGYSPRANQINWCQPRIKVDPGRWKIIVKPPQILTICYYNGEGSFRLVSGFMTS